MHYAIELTEYTLILSPCMCYGSAHVPFGRFLKAQFPPTPHPSISHAPQNTLYIMYSYHTNHTIPQE